MEPWVGRQESELISDWGAPNEISEHPNGKRVLTWITYLGPYGGEICRKNFTVDESGEIHSVDWIDCP